MDTKAIAKIVGYVFGALVGALGLDTLIGSFFKYRASVKEYTPSAKVVNVAKSTSEKFTGWNEKRQAEADAKKAEKEAEAKKSKAA